MREDGSKERGGELDGGGKCEERKEEGMEEGRPGLQSRHFLQVNSEADFHHHTC